jgi:hypothetical protein
MIDFSFEKRKTFPFNPIDLEDLLAAVEKGLFFWQLCKN